MTWRLPAMTLVGCTLAMALSADVPAAGALPRGVFVASSLGAAWACWSIANANGLRMRHVLALAVACRIALLPLLPTLSDDGYRYIWDGLLTLGGASPYATVPQDVPVTDDLVAILYSRLNSPRYFSVYPPASQLAFAIGTWLGGGTLAGAWYGIKALFVACEAVGIACLARVVPARGVALYALHPIAIVEVAGQAHTEGALVGALGLMVWGLSRRSPWAGAAVAAAGWVKLYPFGLAVALGRQGRAWLYATIGGALLVLVLIPGGSLQSIVRSVALYGAQLDFYSAPFLSLKAVLHPVLGTSAGAVASTVMALGWVAVLGALLLQNDQTREGRLRVLALAVVAYALLSPMQHPWNWLGILFVIPLLQNKLWIFWLLSLSLPTYLRYVGPEWAYPGALAVGWGGAAWLWWRARTHAARTPSAVASDASSQV